MRRVLRPQRACQKRILKLPVDEPQELGIDIVCVEPHFVFSSVSRPGSKGPPIASTYATSVFDRVGQKWLDLHAAAVIAEVERQVSVAPDVLLGYCVGLCLDLYFVGMVVTPCGAVASTNRALAYVDVLGESGNCDCDGAAVAAGADRGVCRRHVVS
jgi:hypothetical protein